MTFWACYAAVLPPAVAEPCDAYGDTIRGAEQHTASTGHPTTQGTPAGVAWARRRA